MKGLGLFIAAVLICAGCETSGPANTTLNANVAGNAAPVNTNSALVPYNTTSDPAEFNGNSGNLRVVNSGPANQDSTYGARPAPDNSEFNTTMNARGEVLETRTFKDHPQILKVERKTAGTTKTLKVYLRNGKVYDVSEEKLPNFRVAAPGNILVAIGALPKPVPSDDSSNQKADSGQKP